MARPSSVGNFFKIEVFSVAGLVAVGPHWRSYMAWPRPINQGKRDIDGKKMGQKLSHPSCWAHCWPSLLGMRSAVGRMCVFGWIFQKGYSPTCSYCTCVARAISVVAGRIACRVSIQKITRCSTVVAAAADALMRML